MDPNREHIDQGGPRKGPLLSRPDFQMVQHRGDVGEKTPRALSTRKVGEQNRENCRGGAVP